MVTILDKKKEERGWGFQGNVSKNNRRVGRNTVKLVLKDLATGHKNVVSQDKWSFGDRFNYIEMWDLLPGISGL